MWGSLTLQCCQALSTTSVALRSAVGRIHIKNTSLESCNWWGGHLLKVYISINFGPLMCFTSVICWLVNFFLSIFPFLNSNSSSFFVAFWDRLLSTKSNYEALNDRCHEWTKTFENQFFFVQWIWWQNSSIYFFEARNCSGLAVPRHRFGSRQSISDCLKWKKKTSFSFTRRPKYPKIVRFGRDHKNPKGFLGKKWIFGWSEI